MRVVLSIASTAQEELLQQVAKLLDPTRRNTPPSSQALLPAVDARGPPSDGAGVVAACILRLGVSTSPDGKP